MALGVVGVPGITESSLDEVRKTANDALTIAKRNSNSSTGSGVMTGDMEIIRLTYLDRASALPFSISFDDKNITSADTKGFLNAITNCLEF